MTFACPKSRKHLVQLTDRSCPVCGFPLTVSALSAYYLRRNAKRLMKWLRQATALRCPHCQVANPIHAQSCASCGTAITVGTVTQVTMGPPARGLGRAVKGARAYIKLAIQAAYLVGSAWGLYYYLMRLVAKVGELSRPTSIVDGATRQTEVLLFLAGIGVTGFVVTLAIILGTWLLPRTLLSGFERRASALTKLGVVCNLATLLAVLVLRSGRWWMPALASLALLVLVWLAAWISTRVLWPTAYELGAIVQQTRSGTLDPSKPQGRRGYHI